MDEVDTSYLEPSALAGGAGPTASPLAAALAERGVIRKFRKDAILIQEGDGGDSIYVILDGRVKVFACNDADREFVIDEHGPGEYIGEMSLDGGPRSASVMALTPVVCSVVTRRTLETFIGEHPAFAFELLSRVIRRARVATGKVKDLALLDVYGRVARCLNDLAVPQDELRVLPHEFTQQDIADRIGSSREMVSRILKELVAGGYVSYERRIIRLHRTLPSNW
jgi:CRP/FNR family transcriptional regulator, cyclic AMP receptor protein